MTDQTTDPAALAADATTQAAPAAAAAPAASQAAPDATTVAAGADFAGVDLTAPTVASVKAQADVLLAHIDHTAAATESSTWLESAREAIHCAVAYIEGHFSALEAKIEGDLEKPATSDRAPAAATAAVASAAQ